MSKRKKKEKSNKMKIKTQLWHKHDERIMQLKFLSQSQLDMLNYKSKKAEKKPKISHLLPPSCLIECDMPCSATL